MASESRQRLEALPGFLQPKLRIFLSADLVGSTASKQRPNFPIREPGRLWADGGMSPPWLSPIANFFVSFQEAFIREWRIFKSQVAPHLGIDVAIEPSFWKANGDEIIFVKELSDRKEVLGCINSWMKAAKSVRPQLAKRGMDVKATAWTAGFPVTNSELVFQIHPGSKSAPFEDDPRLQQFSLLAAWYQEAGSQNFAVMDFIGPSVDTGFRLASRSTPRKFVISVDIAYLMATAHLPPTEIIRVPSICYDGKHELKGVLAGKPYPIFWVDTMSGLEFVEREERMFGVAQPHVHLDDLRSFCREFYADNNSMMFLPFIFREDPRQFGELPINYVEALEHLHSKWKQEEAQYKKEAEVEAITDDSEKLSERESDQKENQIISALIEMRSSEK